MLASSRGAVGCLVRRFGVGWDEVDRLEAGWDGSGDRYGGNVLEN